MADRAPASHSGTARRRAGAALLDPVARSWGIGEIADLVPFARWLRSAGLDFVQLLPINEMQEGQSSPYSALSAMAIDPIFIALDDVDELGGGGEERSTRDRTRWQALRQRPARRLRRGARAEEPRASRPRSRRFARSSAEDRRPSRSRAFARFAEREAWWLDDYALFRALHDEHGGRHWRDWEPGVRDRDPGGARGRARSGWPTDVRYYAYLQWIADEQWQRARASKRPRSACSAISRSWSAATAPTSGRGSRSSDLDASVGTPPDAFSETGQDWGLPAYRWDVVAADGLRVAAARARRCAELYDGFRIDHLIGFFRTFVRKPRRPHRLPARRRAVAARAGRAPAVDLRGERRDASSPRTSAPCPTSCASRWPRSGIPGMKVHPLGTAVARGRAAIPRSVAYAADFGRDQRHARHRDAWRNGGTALSDGERRALLALPVFARPGFPTIAVFGSPEGRAARGAVRLRLELADPPVPGHLRLARSGQRARGRQRPELDLAAAGPVEDLAGRQRRRSARRSCAVVGKHGRRRLNRPPSLIRFTAMHETTTRQP